MKHYIIILGFISVLTSCAPSKYFVEAEEILAEIDWTQNLLNYIPLTNDDLQSDILNTTYSLLKSKKHSQLKRYLSTVQDSSDYCLAKTLYCISKANYVDAVYYFNQADDAHALLKKLIYIDLNYELARDTGKHDYNMFLQQYQNLTDEYPDNALLKKIITLRMRYIRYKR
jgi:hypothetical protein